MNITDYLVDYLKQGKHVTIPQIGQLEMRETPAFYDQATSTFFPRQKSVILDNASQRADNFVDYLAQRECVTYNTAAQLWTNYCGALQAKLKSEGRCRLLDLGQIISDNGTFSFDSATSHDSPIEAACNRPVADVREFTHTAGNDPFSAFEQPLTDSVVTTAPFLKSFDASATSHTPFQHPEPEVEEEAPVEEVATEAEATPETNTAVDIETEPETVTVEENNDNVSEQYDSVQSEPEDATSDDGYVPDTAEPEQPATSDDNNDTVDDNADNTDDVEPDTNSDHGSDSAPEEATSNSPSAFADDTISKLQELDAIDESDGSAFDDEEKQSEKKHGRFWKVLLWILVTLIVLAACAFVIDHYLFNSKGRNWIAERFNIEQLKTTTETSEPEFTAATHSTVDKEAASDNITPYTFSTDMLEFSGEEIDAQTDRIMSVMSPYLKNRLKALKQSKHEEAFLLATRQHVNEQLALMLRDDEYHEQCLLNYSDYVREANMASLKGLQLRRKSHAIQSELMSNDLFNSILGKIADIEPAVEETQQKPNDNTGAKNTAKVAKPATTKSTVTTESKKGFDIIAGFSVNKSTADQLCTKLKNNGCDAYIINRNGLYYVSMGSASSRTEIDAKYDHIKEWYKGDISIKKW